MPPAGLTSRARRAKARSTHSVYHSQDVSSLDELNTAPKTAVGLYFATEAEIQSQSAGALILPSIAPFLPDGTPVEVVEDLTALYHSHCSSLIECIRFCKEKNFFHLYTSLPGSMTDPVASLFGHPKIAAWIEECDLVVFRRAVAILSKLTLQIWPKSASTFLDSAANNLVSHICRSLDGLPQHAIEAKVEPAALFCGIIGRMMRVNSAAHSAALNLASDGNRKEMYVEWMKHIRINKIVEVVPSRGTRDVAKLLVDKLRSLLHLEATRLDEEKGTVYGDVVVGHSRATSDNNGAQDGDSESESHCLNALELWVAFVEDLPAHFPYATHAEIVWCAERVSTAVLRELTYASAKSFDAWYATKVFVDELIWLYGERGGFLMFSTSGDADPLSGVSSEATSCNSTQPLAQSSAMGEAPHAISAVGSSTPASKATGSTPAAVVMASTTQSAPMPVSACQADDVRHGGSTSTDQTNDGIYDASTPHSMAGAASVAGEAATHDDSGIGLELEFKVDHTDSPGANADSGPVCGH
jgi:regulatory factor X